LGSISNSEADCNKDDRGPVLAETWEEAYPEEVPQLEAIRNVYSKERLLDQVKREFRSWGNSFEAQYELYKSNNINRREKELKEEFSIKHLLRGRELTAKVNEAEKSLHEAQQLAKKLKAPNRDDQTWDFVDDPRDDLEVEECSYAITSLDRRYIFQWMGNVEDVETPPIFEFTTEDWDGASDAASNDWGESLSVIEEDPATVRKM